MALSDYLASKYLSSDTKKPSKKRKRQKDEASGFQIADDTADSWTNGAADPNGDEYDPQVIAEDPTQINRRTATWKTIGAEAPTNAEQEAADAILAKAETERQNRAAKEVEDDAPAVVGDVDDTSGPTMANGALAGLQTAAQVAAALDKRQRDEKRAMEEQGLDPNGKATETIYRDASGRIINVAMKRAELRRKAEEDEKTKKEEVISRLGDVQRREKEAARQRLDDAKYLAVARYADDDELNDELKDKARWNDPAARFLSTKTTSTSTKSGKAVSRKKVYEGAHEPNRYTIKPGYRWDGVDRSNGFERKWFAARNKKANVKELEYAWEMDE